MNFLVIFLMFFNDLKFAILALKPVASSSQTNISVVFSREFSMYRARVKGERLFKNGFAHLIIGSSGALNIDI